MGIFIVNHKKVELTGLTHQNVSHTDLVDLSRHLYIFSFHFHTVVRCIIAAYMSYLVLANEYVLLLLALVLCLSSCESLDISSSVLPFINCFITTSTQLQNVNPCYAVCMGCIYSTSDSRCS